MPMRRVISAANTELHANRNRARPAMKGYFFMFVFSRLLLVWQDRRKSWNGMETFFCTYNSILDFYVLAVNEANGVVRCRLSQIEKLRIESQKIAAFGSSYRSFM